MDNEFLDLWRSVYSRVAPLAWHLREAKGENWFRVYSLPQGKRYPSNLADTEILLGRFNDVASSVFGEKREVFVAVPTEFEKHSRYKPDSIPEIDSYSSFECATENDTGDTYVIHYNKQIWEPGHFDDLIKGISNDEIMQTIIMSADGSLMAPYDGGSDVFVSEPAIKSKLMRKFAKWLSDQKDGL